MAVDNASDHIVITNPNGIVLYANKAVEKITGFSKEEIIGEKVGDGSNWGKQMDGKFYKRFWKRIKEDKKSFSGELTNKRKNGEIYNAEAHVSPILNNEGDVIFFVGIERDITKAKEIDLAKTEFVSLASHQLRTPLTTIRWYTEMLLENDKKMSVKDRMTYLNEVYHGNQRMIDLVSALLNVSRLELGTFSIEPEQLNVMRVLDDLLSDLKIQIDEKKLKVKIKKKGDIPKIKLDRKLIRMVFQNLLTNSIKYTHKSGSINIQVEKKTKELLLTFTDDGVGIPLEHQDDIFTKLYRADNVKERDTEGTGLGLYIVKTILDKTGGEITVKSKENKGTTFCIKIPLKGMKAKKGTKRLA